MLNSHIWNYLLAVLQGKELPEISEYSAESANCGQHEWLTEVEKEIRQHTGCEWEGRRMTGGKGVESMIPLHDRSNGLGGGFAASYAQIPLSQWKSHHARRSDDGCNGNSRVTECIIGERVTARFP